MKNIRTGFCLLLALTLLTGILYPLTMTVLAQTFFPRQANGSLLIKEGHILGSELIGQSFTQDRYFHGRPSAANYDATLSGGTNLAPTSRILLQTLRERTHQFRADNQLDNQIPIPADSVSASASGLDPDISLISALLQANRVADRRHLPPAQIRQLIHTVAKPPQLGLLGEERVNVLTLNLALDALPQSN